MDLSNENVVHIKTNGIEYIQFKRLLEYKDKISHAYSLGVDVNYRTSIEDNVQNEKTKENYNKLCREIGLNVNNIIKPTQQHTRQVKVVKEQISNFTANTKEYDATDGLVTNRKNVLATSNADCILLLFYDPVKNVIANTHSGWKGTLQRISVETVKKMKEEYECNAQDIICCICPSIRKCHFEVSKDVKDLFYEEFKDLKEINEIITGTKPNEKWNIDTVLINKIILGQQGLEKENIIDSGICSMCNSNIIHSYRAEGEGYGLSTAIIGLK